MATTVLHEPRLDTILMVEREIQKAKSYPTKKELWQHLPRKLQYQTFNRILDYLEGSNKILLDKGEIVWTFPSNPKLRKLLETPPSRLGKPSNPDPSKMKKIWKTA